MIKHLVSAFLFVLFIGFMRLVFADSLSNIFINDEGELVDACGNDIL